MIETWRRLPVLDRVAVVYAAVYVAWIAARNTGFPVPGVVGDVAFYPLGLAIGWANWRNSRVASLDSRTRLAWGLLASAAFVLWTSGTTWTICLSLGVNRGAADWIDRIGFFQFVLAIIAYLVFPGRSFRRGNPRFAFDVALIVVATSLLGWYCDARLTRFGTAPIPTLTLAELSLNWALFALAAIGGMQKRDLVTRRVLTLLLASSLVSVFGNFHMAMMPAYHNGDPVDTWWFAAWALRWSAARFAWNRYESQTGELSETRAVDQDYRSNPFAYVLVAVAFLLLFGESVAGDARPLVALTVGATTLGTLLIVRQYAELEENRRLFEARIEGQARFRALVQHSSDVVLVVGTGGRLTYVSPAATQVFGDATRVVPGVALRELLAPEASAMAEALEAPGPTAPARVEVSMEVAPGRWRDIEAVWSDERSDPAIDGVVLNCRDVTERNEVERQLRQTQRLEVVGHLAGGLAHDLNNVLTIIRGYTDLVRTGLRPGSPPERDVEQVLMAVDRASMVTGKVLAFSRKQAGEVRLLDVNSLILELASMLRHSTDDQEDVQIELGVGVWPVRGDQGQVEQLLVNLVTNAVDAMPEGGTVRVATENRLLTEPLAWSPSETPRLLTPGRYVALTVSDEGTGIAADVLPHIFEPFYSTKPKDRGMGLGLAIVLGIVTDMNGGIRVETTLQKGSRFTVFLPAASPDAASK